MLGIKGALLTGITVGTGVGAGAGVGIAQTLKKENQQNTSASYLEEQDLRAVKIGKLNEEGAGLYSKLESILDGLITSSAKR